MRKSFKPLWSSLSALSALCASLAASAALAAPPVYKIHVLMAQNDIRPYLAWDINNRGEIAGVGYHTDTRDKIGVRYQHGVATELPDSPDPDIFEINEAGDVIGWMPDGHGYIWHADGTREMVTGNIKPKSLNTAGQVAGTTWSGPQRALRWESGVATDLGDLGGCCSMAEKINEAGHVTGSSYTDANAQRHAYLWHDGEMHDLGLLPDRGGWYSGGLAINALDHVTGTANDRNGHVMPFLHDGITMKRLPPLDGELEFEPKAINVHDEVVGTTNTSRAVFYRRGHTYDLKSLLDASGEGWDRLLSADGINDKGQIVGTGYHHGRVRAYVARVVKPSGQE